LVTEIDTVEPGVILVPADGLWLTTNPGGVPGT